jgi:O-antigen/teichoic acid export membrane protein
LSAPDDDIEALAKGGRTNVLGFLLRLAARLPFLFIAGRVYGAEALGRMAYAVLIVEFAAQMAAFGLRRGLAFQLSQRDSHDAHEAWDALSVVLFLSAPAALVLMIFPKIMFPNSVVNGLDYLLPLAIFGVAATDVMLAALAYRFDVGATVRARAIIEPWTISLAAWGLSYYSLRDGLLLSYSLSIAAAFIAASWPFLKSYGLPAAWFPYPRRLAILARRNLPLAAADAIEWGSRRLDLAILGLFVAPATVGIYYVAQQVATLPQKLKSSFDPILGPVITRNLEGGNMAAVAKQVSQVGFWIIAAQAGIALALAITGEGVMGLVGPHFVSGTGAAVFLLIAEVAAATAVVSEAALVYIARHRNLLISLAMIGLQAGLSFAVILALRQRGMGENYLAAGAAASLAVSLGLGSLIKVRLVARLLKCRVSVWRWPLAWASLVAGLVGSLATRGPEWSELVLGIPAILGTYWFVIWRWGFGDEDRALFRKGSQG